METKLSVLFQCITSPFVADEIWNSKYGSCRVYDLISMHLYYGCVFEVDCWGEQNLANLSEANKFMDNYFNRLNQVVNFCLEC